MTQDENIELACQTFGGIIKKEERKNFLAFAKLVADKEREACAVICETYWNRPNNGMSTEEEVCGSVTAELIRARGQE